jgi:peptide/nickel transport system substrate-binding protein
VGAQENKSPNENSVQSKSTKQSVSTRWISSFKKSDGRKKDNGKEQSELDKKLVYSLSKSRIPSWRQLKYIKRFLSNRERWIIRISSLVIFLTVITWGAVFYLQNLQVVPVSGGVYTEGLLGSPKYINPLYLSVSDVDNDLGNLIYSSLFKRGKNGELLQDLADGYEISEEGKRYTVNIRQNVTWHDATPLTADDIIFTFNAIKDSQYKSPIRNSFVGVNIEKISDQQIAFSLSDPYAAFLELLSFGILPSALWSQIPPESASLAELNLKPIGSGPYQFDKLIKDKNGNIKEYHLVVNENYYLPQPFLDLRFVFFQDFEEAVEAVNNNVVQGLSYLPPEYQEEILTPKAFNFHKLYVPQLTLLFFNQNANPALADKSVRQSLALGINRNDIAQNVLIGDAYIVHGPILPSSFAYKEDIKQYNHDQEKARELLDNTDWKINEITKEMLEKAREDKTAEDEKIRAEAETILGMGEGEWRKKHDKYLIIRLATVDRNENAQIVEAIKRYWEQIGIKTEVKVFPVSVIQSEVIRERNFDSLFYGQVVGSDPDPYAFWHSSQTGDEGFNIANFVNKEVDELLEDARLVADQNERKEKYFRFQEIIAEEVPAIFMYSPLYTYMQSGNVKGFAVRDILLPRDRFANVEEWYLRTGQKLIWPKNN